MAKLDIKVVDMKAEMNAKAQEVILEAFENLREERAIADFIKLAFDKYDNPCWNCIVGKNFGSHVVHQS